MRMLTRREKRELFRRRLRMKALVSAMAESNTVPSILRLVAIDVHADWRMGKFAVCVVTRMFMIAMDRKHM
jgi:hypothetical protein